MPECPYCRQQMQGDDINLVLPMRQRRIYDAVAASGSAGIPKESLALVMYHEGQKPTPAALGVLRVVVHGLNQSLSDYGKRVVARGGHYYLIAE